MASNNTLNGKKRGAQLVESKDGGFRSEGFIAEKHFLSKSTYDAMRISMSHFYRVSRTTMPANFVKHKKFLGGTNWNVAKER